MGKVNIGWNPKYASKNPQPNKVPKYSDTGVLKSETPDKYDSNDSVVNIDYLDKYINGPKSIDVGSTVSASASALCAVNNRIFIGSTNKVESFFSTGGKGRETTANMENAALVPAIAECGNGNILTAKGNALIETSYYLTASYKRLMFSDTSQYITAVATYDLGSSVVVAIGTSTGRVGLFKYKPGSSTDFISSNAFTSTVESTLPNTSLDITNKLYIYSNNNPITDILLTSDRLIIGNSNTAGTVGSAAIYSYSISSTNTSIILIGSVSAVAGRGIGIDLVDNDTSLIIGFINGSCNKYSLDNVSSGGMSYNQQRSGTDLIDMVTDNDENIYLLYSDGLLRKVNSADVKLWDYQTEIGGIPLSMSIDKDNYYIVVCNTNGQFEIISYMTGKNLTKSTESALMMLKAQVLPGDYIEKIEVCQLDGKIELDGDITGSVDLKADNTCLIDPDNADHTIHKIKIDTKLSDNCASNIMIYKGIVGAITTEAYEDELSGWTDIAYGETSEGGIFVGIKSLSDVAGYTYDGKTWYKTSLPGKLEWTAVTYGNGKFVAIAKNTGVFASSTDGIRWTKYESLFANHHWVDIAFGNDRFLVISKIGASAYSTDGENWIYDDTLPDLNINDDHVWVSLTYGSKGFVAISTKSSVAALTEDGTNWRTVSLPSGTSSVRWRDTAFGNNEYMAIGNDSSGFTKTAISNDGINWTTSNQYLPDEGYDWCTLIYYENMFVAAGKETPMLAFIVDSKSKWDYMELPEESYDGTICCGISKLACGNGIIVGSVELTLEEESVSRIVKRNYVGYNTMDLPIIHKGGWTYKVAKAGTYAGIICEEGDFITCIKSGNYKDDDHWSSVQANVTIGNKTTAGLTKLYTEIGNNTDGTMTQSAITKSLNNLLATNDAMIFKGTIGTGGTVTTLPVTHEIGWTYRVITDGSYSNHKCESGDLIICIKDGTIDASGDWTVAQTNIDGAVSGPSLSENLNIAVFDGKSGKIIKDSGKRIDNLLPNSNDITTLSFDGPFLKFESKNNSGNTYVLKDALIGIDANYDDRKGTNDFFIDTSDQISLRPNNRLNKTAVLIAGGGEFDLSVTCWNPDKAAAASLGSWDWQWNKIFCLESTNTVVSDIRKKHDVNYDLSKYKDLLKKIKPITYRLNDNPSKVRIGFSAQNVKEELINLDINYKEQAFIDEYKCEPDNEITDGIAYNMTYGDFIPLNTAMIQDLQKENEELKSRIAKLEELVDNLINK